VIQQTSPTTGRKYPIAVACRVLGVCRSTFYAREEAEGKKEAPAKRGPKTKLSDEQLVGEIRTVIREAPFSGEGHRKVKARLALKGMHVGKKRVLRLMRQNGLLAPTRQGKPHGNPAHDGTILKEKPNEMWGTDATKFWTEKEGWCWFFFAIDHCSEDVVGHHESKVGDRFAALEPIRQGVRKHLGGIGKDVARGLQLRSDHGSQFTSEDFTGEMKFYGIGQSFGFVQEPECNGLAEHFVRILKEQCLWVHRFKDLEEARRIIGEFIERYNSQWILERFGYRTPNQVREGFALAVAA
jgi:transposase InsO family protein